jgi:hypothetical protein
VLPQETPPFEGVPSHRLFHELRVESFQTTRPSVVNRYPSTVRQAGFVSKEVRRQVVLLQVNFLRAKNMNGRQALKQSPDF